MVPCRPEDSSVSIGGCLVMGQLPLYLSESRWRVLQPAIYLISILPAFVCALLFKSSLEFPQFLLVGLAVVLIQHAVNVFNDEVDWKKGADGEKKDSWYHFHQGDVGVLKTHAWVSLILGLFIGISLLIQKDREEILWVALPLVLLGFFYNHSKWTLSYSKWGEWVTGLCYGPGVFGCMAYLLMPEFSWKLICGSLTFSFLAVAVLLSHQPPQVLTDFAAGKSSFAVRNGAVRTYQTARVLTFFTFFFLTLLLNPKWEISILGLTPLALLAGFALALPKRPSPASILKLVTFQVLALGLLKAERFL